MSRATVKQISILRSYPFCPSIPHQFTTDSLANQEHHFSYSPENPNLVISKVQSAIGRTDDEIFQSLMHDQACTTIPISDNLLSHLLNRFKNDWKSALGIFKWAKSQKVYNTPLPNSYAIMLDILGKTKQTEKMMSLLTQTHDPQNVTLASISKVMRRLCGAGKWQEAVKIFDDLPTFGLEKNNESMNILLDTLCKENKVEQARKIFLELKSCIQPTPHTFNIFINGWCKANRVEEALWTIQEMKGYGFSPSVITYSTIIKSYCEDSKFDKVYELLDEMKSRNCPPNVVTFTIIMCYLTKFGEIDEALGIPEKMKYYGCEPDTLFYNALIHTLAKAGRVQEAVNVFEVEMEKFKVVRNTSTCNSMIAMFCHHGMDQKAVDVLRSMGDMESCWPDVQSFHPILKMWFGSRKVESWLDDLLDEMVNKYHVSLDLSTYTLVIHGLCRVGRCEWAYRLFKEMIGKDITPRYFTCALLLDEIKQMKNYDAVDFIEGYMKRMK